MSIQRLFRLRQGRFGKLILQVGEKGWIDSITGDSYRAMRWKDAKISDIDALSQILKEIADAEQGGQP